MAPSVHSPTMRPPRPFVLAAVLLLPAAPFISASLCAQQQPAIVVQAQAVVEDVVVTARNGQPVVGLTASDFKLSEDGKPQTINYFQPHTAASQPTPVAALPPMPPHVYTNVPATSTSGPVDILLLDALDTPTLDYTYARDEVKQFLDHVHPGAHLAIFALGNKLYCLQGFTTNTASLSSSLSGRLAEMAAGDGSTLFGFASGVASSTPTDGAIAISRTTHGSPAAAAARADAEANFMATQELIRAQKTLDALDYLSHYLSPIEGRKNLIWFSSTFPAFLAPEPEEKEITGVLAALQPHIHSTINNLGTARVAVYPVFAGGIMNEQVYGSDMAIPASADAGGHFGSSSPMTPYQQQSSDRASVLSSMNLLAHDTGGKPIDNTNDLAAAVQRDLADGATYYTLSYTPTNHKQNGHLRRVDIQLIHPSGMQLAYRRAYYANPKTPPAAAHSPLQPLLAFGLPSISQILYGLRVDSAPLSQPTGTATNSAKRVQPTPLLRYNARFLLRASDLSLRLAPDGTRTGTLELALAAYDRSGKLLKVADETEYLRLTAVQYAAVLAGGLPVSLHLDLPNAPLQLQTGVYDPRTGNAGTLSLPLPQ